MHARQPVPEDLLRLAQLQAGVVSREQAIGLGLTPKVVGRLVTTGSWLRLSRGIFLTAPVPPSWSAWAWSAVLVGGDAARLGGASAGHLHGLVPEPPPQIEVLIPHSVARPTVPGPWLFTRERPGTRQPRTVGSPPRITIEDAVLDLVDDGNGDDREVVNLLTIAVQSRRTTPRRILQAAQTRHFLRRRSLISAVLDDVAAGARSPIEVDYLNLVERAHGLPPGRRQVSRRTTEVDVLYEAFALLVELDGRLGHEGMGRFRDMRRDNAATTDGLATLRYGKADVFGIPCEVAVQVARNLMLRGWEGPGHPCDRCIRAAHEMWGEFGP